MLLTELRIVNYRCYEDITFERLDRLAVFVGENDVGKTQLMNAVTCLLSGNVCSAEDYRDLADDARADEVVLEGTFRIEPHDTLPDEYRTGAPGAEVTRITKRFTKSGVQISCAGKGYTDDRFDDLKGADHQKDLLRSYKITPAGREEARLAQLNELRGKLLSTSQLELCEREVVLPSFNVLQGHMPRVERVASTDFRSPDEVVNRVLRDVAASVVKPMDSATGQPRERDDLRAVRGELEQRLNEEVRKAEATPRRILKNFKGLTVHPNIDFSRSVSSNTLAVDLGSGSRAAVAFGRGTNNRLWMGLLEWEREVARKNISGSVLRLYDEPDVNLHYEAQRELFRTILSLSQDEALHVQCFVCTHAVTLIDRASPGAINLITANEGQRRSVRRLHTDGVDDYTAFMHDVGQAVGLSNTALLYERAFLVVEGEGEQEALPTIYRTVYGRGLRDDGIVLVPLFGVGAWKSAITLLLKNRLGMTYMLLDADCKKPGSSMKMRPSELARLGCPPDFVANQVEYIGTNEFEDAFEDAFLASALSDAYPRVAPLAWSPDEIGALRSGAKFSTALVDHVQQTCVADGRTAPITKVTLARILARRCREESDMPAALARVFRKLRAAAGV